MKNKIIIFKCEELLGGYDLDELRKSLSGFFKPRGIDVVLLNSNIALLSEEDLKKFIAELKGVLK